MGGGAFQSVISVVPGHPSLRTPRMDTATYMRLRDIYAQKFRKCFPDDQISHLKEAPEKSDHGDIDYLIATNEQLNSADVAAQIGAAGFLSRGPDKASFAVRQDGSAADEPIQYREVKSSTQSAQKPPIDLTEEPYAQIDINLIPPQQLEWQAFQNDYGDLAPIIGNIVRNLGFTITNQAIFLRLRELDEAKDVHHQPIAHADGMLWLSRDPQQVMKFLGLDVDEYLQSFDTLESLFTWVATCRFLMPEAVNKKRDLSRDRQKARKRTTFNTFFNEWLPAHKKEFELQATANETNLQNDDISDEQLRLSTAAETKLHQARQSALHEALEYFDKRKEYFSMHEALVRKCDNAAAVRLLQPIIAAESGKTGDFVKEVVKAFRRWVGFQDGRPTLVSDRHTDGESQLHQFLAEDKQTLRNEAEVRLWVQENWEAVRAKERRQAKTGDGGFVRQ